MAGMNPGFAKYLADKKANKGGIANVGSTPKMTAPPLTPKTGNPMTNAKVGSKGIPAPTSSGSMPSSVPGVNLGTFHGKHHVNHPIK